MIEVNKQRVKLWVDALRSKQFKQGIGQLKNHGAYCCLGVACEVAKENGLRVKYYDAQGDLPSKVTKWFGFSNNNPQVTKRTDCTKANDLLKYSFNKIADLIERRYLKPAKKAAR